MTAPGGRRRATEKPAALPLRALALNLLGVVAAGLAWVVLVRAAIDFGRDGRAGESVAWLFLVLASVGAVGCLLLALVLVGRMLVVTGVISEYKPKRARRRP